MTARELIIQLERFDPNAQVVVATPDGARFTKDVGRRERSALDVHPVIYLVEDENPVDVPMACQATAHANDATPCRQTIDPGTSHHRTPQEG